MLFLSNLPLCHGADCLTCTAETGALLVLSLPELVMTLKLLLRPPHPPQGALILVQNKIYLRQLSGLQHSTRSAVQGL